MIYLYSCITYGYKKKLAEELSIIQNKTPQPWTQKIDWNRRNANIYGRMIELH